MNKIITFKDHFQWLHISDSKAIDLYESIELFAVNEDEQSESLITSLRELKRAIFDKQPICIELGHCEEEKKWDRKEVVDLLDDFNSRGGFGDSFRDGEEFDAWVKENV